VRQSVDEEPEIVELEMDASAVAAVGAGMAAIAAGCTILAFWMRFSDRITKADSKAENAAKRADELAKQIDECHGRITTQAAQFAMYREQVAREYIHRESMREVEDRLTQAIDRLGDRLDRALERDRQVHMHHPTG
jgi:uncharacterized protein HemX